MNRKELVKRLKYMIKSVAPNSQTILYGSEARGEAKQNSDCLLYTSPSPRVA